MDISAVYQDGIGLRRNMKIYTNQDERLHSVRQTMTLKDMWLTGVELYGDKPAFCVKEERGGAYRDVTYEQALEDINAVGTYLLEHGLKGEKIAVMGSNCYQWMVAYFAVTLGAGVVVPLDKEATQGEIHNLLKKAQCKALFYTDDWESKVEDAPVEHLYRMNVYEEENDSYLPNHIRNMIVRGKISMEDGDRSFLDLVVDPHEEASILFTSGTTGNPKGVMLSNRNITHVLEATSKIVKLRDDDKALSILPIHHTFESTIGIMVVLFQGGAIAFFEGLKYVLKNIQESKASILVGVPLIVESIYDKIWKQAEKTGKAGMLRKAIKLNRTLTDLGIDKRRTIFKSVYKNFGGNLRLIICGAAALQPTTVRGFMDLGFDLSQGYGLTETAPLLTGVPDFEMAAAYMKAGSCGPVIPGGEMQIINPDESGIGEIIYRGDNVMLGYYEMEEETADVIKDGWFHTGDLGFVDESGWLYITGRSKNVIVTKTGKNIYPEELEALVNSLDGVKDSLVYGREEDGGQDIIVAVQIIPDRDELPVGISPEELDQKFREEISNLNMDLPSYKRIRNIVIREEDFVRTTTKKIKRQDNL